MAYSYPMEINSSSGFETVFQYLGTEVANFGTAILFLIWCVILGSTYYSQQRRRSVGDIVASSVVASIITTGGAFILYLVPGIISLSTIIIFMILSLVTTGWLFLRGD